MRRVLWQFFICCLIFFSITPYSIVFVHLGPSLPAYLPDALFQARLFNKNCKIFLLGNEQTLSSYSDNNNLQITLVPVEGLAKTKAHQEFLKTAVLDRRFRDGFWYYASERFLYLDDFMQQYDMHHVFHLETDTMLYVDLKEMKQIFVENYHGIAAVFDNDDRCIPCFVYFGSKNAAHKLARYFFRYAQQGKNDMEVLAIFKKKHSELIDNLPIIMSSYQTKHSLCTPAGRKTNNPDHYSKNSTLFKSVFDGAALGQYLGGIDPRVGLSVPGFINESCLFNPSHVQYLWKNDELGRKVPFMVFGDEVYRINNLHIHSKNLKEFLSVPRL